MSHGPDLSGVVGGVVLVWLVVGLLAEQLNKFLDRRIRRGLKKEK